MTLSTFTATIALVILAGAQPLHAQEFTAYTVKPELRNLAEIRPMVDSAAARLLKSATPLTVLLWATVRRDGSTGDVSIRESSGHAGLDNAAIKVVQSMQWVPGRDDIGPTEVRISLPVVFRKDGRRQ